MRRIFFYLNYATTNLRNSGHWTVFAVFCVAAGVATVVALRSLGLAITDSLLSNLRLYNHGDINLSSVANFGPFSATFQRGNDERSVFTPNNIRTIEAWATRNNAQLSIYTIASNVQISATEQGSAGRPQFTSSYLIDPKTFALAGAVVALDPAGVPLEQLFTGGHDVVISKNLADSQNLKVGDQVRVSGTEEPFIVRGIVATENEANVNNILAAFFGFAYFNASDAGTLQLSTSPNTIGINLPDGASEDQIINAANELQQMVPIRDINTTPWLLRRNEYLSDLVGRFIVTMGLGAMLIGGVGIMNTMLVLVGRRSMEIAALKTFGLKGRQVATLFVSEAFLLGVMGSVAGIIVGLLLSGVVNGFGEAFLQQKLPWRIHGEAILYGAVLGMVVTMVFGVLPVLTATRVRPAIVLRPNETHIPRATVFQSCLALLVVIVVLGIVAGQIMAPVLEPIQQEVHLPSPIVLGIIGVSITILILGILTGVMWVVVWIVGHLPTFGSVDLRLALRNLSTRRMRTATTLLALTAGMFALSSITYFGLGAREIVRIQFAQTLGGNVMMVPLLPRQVAQPVIDYALSFQKGVEYNTILSFNTGSITDVDGKRIEVGERRRSLPISVLIRDSNNPGLTSGPVLAGRDLTPEDHGKNVIVLSEQSAVSSLISGVNSLADVGIKVGSLINVRVSGSIQQFEVVGIVGNINRFTPNIASAYIPPGIPGINSSYQINVIQVAPEELNQFLINMQSLPLVFTVDVTFIDGLLQRLIEQLSAIPIVVGLLSLLAAAVIMANTVSLTILERRRQIGVLKALGLKRRRVLWVVLLENTVIGLLGGILGIGVSSLGVSIMTLLGAGSAIPLPSDATWITIGLIVASVVIAWVATLLSARVAIDERVTSILRYE